MSGDTWALYCLSHQGSPPYIYVCIYIYYIHTHIRVKLKAKKLPLKILSSLKLHLLVSPPFHRPPPLCHTALPLKRESWWWFCLDCTERERALIFFFWLLSNLRKLSAMWPIRLNRYLLHSTFAYMFVYIFT